MENKINFDNLVNALRENATIRYQYQMDSLMTHFLRPRRACMFCGSTDQIFTAGYTSKTGLWYRCRGHGGKTGARFIDVETGMPVFIYPDERDSIDAWCDEEGIPRV